MLDALLRDRTLAAPELRGMLAVGDLLVFTASAEASQNTYEDGEILGSVVGTIDRGGEVRRLRTIRRYRRRCCRRGRRSDPG